MNIYTLSQPQAVVDIPVITLEPIDICQILHLGHNKKAGGIVLFSGEVRDHHDDKVVTYLEYEAYVPMAEKMIRQIIASAIEKWSLHFAYCVHRIGKLQVCESAVVVVTSHSHRNESYQANKYIIDRVKHEAPIWKNEFYEDGTSLWGGNCHCPA